MQGNKWISVLIIILAHPIATSQVGPVIASDANNPKPTGFIVYCPCMGRFGNQAEQLLGSLYFAKLLNRTLVLPPFIHYNSNHNPQLVPSDQVIQTDPLKEYHEVILLSDFMDKFSDLIWPVGARKFYCHSPRDTSTAQPTCDALKGQPFNTFWSSFNITEDESSFYKPLSTNPGQSVEWVQSYPPSEHPVLTFVGAPSPFPAHKNSISIQKFIKLSSLIENEAVAYKMKQGFPDKPYLSIHIRHGSDWTKACELLRNGEGLTQLFSSNQCTGYPARGAPLSKKLDYDTCLPSTGTIIQSLERTLSHLRRRENLNIEIVHIATDYDESGLWLRLRSQFPQLKFVMVPQDSDTMTSTLIDVYLMAHSDAFIGNCVSSFSAFPARMRTEQLNKKHLTFYFGQKITESTINDRRDEL